MLKQWFTVNLIFVYANAFAQFSIDGQLLQRAEYRHGYGKLIAENQNGIFLIGQRARVQVQFKHEKIRFYVSGQDVRTWGSTPQAKESDNYFSIHEAYVEVPLNEFWVVKLGRQELNYDNARFLGNLDWALQARAHDFGLVKFEKEALKLHVGGGYNQVKESLVSQPYTIPNQYKTAQLLRVEKERGSFKAVALFWNQGMAQLSYDTLGKVTHESIRFSQTLGIPTLQCKRGKFTFSGFYYFQVGRDGVNKKIRAHNMNVQITHRHTFDKVKGSTFQSTLGAEYLSGTSQQPDDNLNRSYNPFYGTNHAHNGYMDFFYVGNRHVNSVGLQDYFLRLRWSPKESFFLSCNVHQLLAAAGVYDGSTRVKRYFGTEVDLTAGYIFNDILSLQGGYSQFFASETMKISQGVTTASNRQNWGYLALLVRPNMKNRFVGLLL